MAVGWHPIKIPHTNANLTHPFSEVTVYGPTSPRSTANSSLEEDFYQLLQVVVDAIPRKEVTVLMGDRNAKVEKCCNTDICLFRSIDKGSHHDNGEAFIWILWSIQHHHCQQPISIPLKTHHNLSRSTRKARQAQIYSHLQSNWLHHSVIEI